MAEPDKLKTNRRLNIAERSSLAGQILEVLDDLSPPPQHLRRLQGFIDPDAYRVIPHFLDHERSREANAGVHDGLQVNRNHQRFLVAVRTTLTQDRHEGRRVSGAANGRAECAGGRDIRPAEFATDHAACPLGRAFSWCGAVVALGLAQVAGSRKSRGQLAVAGQHRCRSQGQQGWGCHQAATQQATAPPRGDEAHSRADLSGGGARWLLVFDLVHVLASVSVRRLRNAHGPTVGLLTLSVARTPSVADGMHGRPVARPTSFGPYRRGSRAQDR